MNSIFRDYTTSGAFVLTLSRSQLDALCHTVEREFVVSIRSMAANGLLRRGLIERTSKTCSMDGKEMRQFGFKPTMAGVIMYELLAEAGLVAGDFDEIERHIAKYQEMRHEAYATRAMRESIPSEE